MNSILKTKIEKKSLAKFILKLMIIILKTVVVVAVVVVVKVTSAL
jgi:hypothetical protein